MSSKIRERTRYRDHHYRKILIMDQRDIQLKFLQDYQEILRKVLDIFQGLYLLVVGHHPKNNRNYNFKIILNESSNNRK